MNRKNLTAAVLAGLAGAAGIASSAQAVNLNPDGLGQLLIYPYYTSNDGNETLMSVVNTTDSAKAVKVRFLEGYNSREVLDFNLYMSHHDVWVAAITDGGTIDPSQEGVPHLVVPDTSCTVPYLYGDTVDTLGFGLQEFLPFAYTGDFADGGPTGISRAAEGHIEVIEMGTLTNESEFDSADAATHILVDGKPVPADCDQLVDAWTDFASGEDGYWFAETEENTRASIDTSRNSGGLFGGAAIINGGRGTMYSYNARAIQGYDKKPDGNHFRPGNDRPSLDDGDQTTATVFFGVPRDEADKVRYARTVDAVSAVFMHEYIMNEYNIEANLAAASEWIVTFPTKNWYVDETKNDLLTEEVWVPDQADDGCLGWDPGEDFPERDGPDPDDGFGPDSDSDGIPDVQEVWALCTYVEIGGELDNRPFTSTWDGEACEGFNLEVWDREESVQEGGPDRPPIVSPPPPGDTPDAEPFEMCYEVNVLRFGDADVFGTDSDLLLTISDTPENGWARIQFPRVECNDPGTEGCREDGYVEGHHIDWAGLVGLPATGFWALQYTNGFIGTPEASVLANYGGLFDHKGSVRKIAPGDRIPD